MSVSDLKPAVILVVEDDPDQRELVGFSLREAGYTVLEAATGESALTILCGMPGVVDWLYVDVRLPGVIDGWRIADEFHLSHPQRPIIYASGYPSDGRRAVPGSLFFQKPYRLADLVKAFQDLSGEPPEEPAPFRPATEGPLPGDGPFPLRRRDVHAEDGSLSIDWAGSSSPDRA